MPYDDPTPTKPGHLGREETDKIADRIFNKLNNDEQQKQRKTVRELVVQWWIADALIVTGLVALLFTGVPMGDGVLRVAWANEVVQQRDAAIGAAQRAVTDRIDIVERKVDELSDVVIEQVITNLASNICRYNMRRTRETDADERQRLLTQINEMRARYRKFAKVEFNMADC